MSRTLSTAMDYYPALLCLMGRMGEARTAEVIVEFQREFGNLIPPEHREQTGSGHTRWEHYVHWARLLLVQACLMASGRRGVWSISPAGKAWLDDHPDGGDWRDLKALTLEGADASPEERGPQRPIFERFGSSLPSKPLQTAMDYRPALLWVMAQIGDSQAAAAVESFDRMLGRLIPEEHRARTQSGRPKWDEYVRWSRQDLAGAGLMGAEERGLWTITEDGRQWLREHPDGGGDELLRRLRPPQRAPARASAVATQDRVRADQRKGVQLRGHTYTLSREEALAAVKSAIANGLPREASRFQDWFLLVDGQRVSVKWVVCLITGLAASEFQSAEARRVLRTLGLEASDKREDMSPAPSSSLPPSGSDLDYDAFFQVVRERLEGRMPAGLGRHTLIRYRNMIQVASPLSRSHYELWLGRAQTEFGLHMEGKRDRNYTILRELEPHVQTLSQQLGEPVLAERWGRDWAKLYIQRPKVPADGTAATRLADDWLRFIVVTLPILQDMARDPNLAGRKRRSAAEVQPENLARQQAILADQVRSIRGFLAGNHGGTPSDEKICEWVQFCYQFELFSEAAALFRLVRPEQVNSWLYERATRHARASELHTARGR